MISSGDTSIRKSKIISRRIFIVSIAKVIVFTGIIGRLFSLQVNENKKYHYFFRQHENKYLQGEI